ncbi:MAG: acyl-CoA thioesterase, partial [Bdellovibrionota bacterium]
HLFSAIRRSALGGHHPRGYGLKEVQRRKQGPIVLSAEIQFLQELKLREKIVIKTRCLPFKGKVAKIEQTMVRSDGTAACEVSYTTAFFDLTERKIIPPIPEWLKAVGLSE